MTNEKRIRIDAKDILKLLREEEITARIDEVYYDLDAEDYLQTGKSEWITIEVEKCDI